MGVVLAVMAVMGVGQGVAAADPTPSVGKDGPPASVNGAGVLDDALLGAMKDELSRVREQLVLPGMQRPYFIEYRLEDVHNYQLSASYGALTGETEGRQRFVRVEVRIGRL